MEEGYLENNRNAWNKRSELHFSSAFYDVEGFLNGKSSLNPIELELLGDVSGKSILHLHLQCHFGQDSISLSRLGAEVTGIDLSDKAIDLARELAEKDHSSTKFICCDIYDLPLHLDEKFDIVFTSYGTIGWLPDLDKWAKIIAEFLKPNGRFVFVEFHPFVWMFDNEFDKIQYNYFKDEAIIETKDESYTEGKLAETISEISWNHSVSEVVNSLIKNNLEIRCLEEFDHSPYNIFPEMEEVQSGKFQIKKFGNKLPLLYAIQAIKTG